MIPNLNDPLPTVVKALLHSKFAFYLTGSRYFNTNTKDSDWDFFTGGKNKGNPNHLKELVTELEGLGFYSDKLAVSNYCDMCMTRVMSHNVYSVQIQIVSSINAKFVAQHVIKTRGLLTQDKETNKVTWNAVLNTLFATHPELWDDENQPNLFSKEGVDVITPEDIHKLKEHFKFNT